MIAPTIASTPKEMARMRNAFAGLTTIQKQAIYMTVVERQPVEWVAHILDLSTDVIGRIASAACLKVYEDVAL